MSLDWLFIILLIIAIIVILIIIYCKFSSDHERSIHEILFPGLYSTRFHESMFVCKDNSYQCRNKMGYDMLSKNKVCIVGLAYNLGNKVEKLIRKCKRLLSPWHKDSSVVVYCYDSTDDTFNYLKNKQAENPWLILPEIVLENKKNMSRLVRMAHLRNICLQHIDKSADYILITDYDLSGPLSLDGIANSISYMNKYEKDSYDVMCANGLLSVVGLNIHLPFAGWDYYDPFAVKMLDGYRPTTGPFNSLIMKRGDAPIDVISGFGGAGLYKIELFTKKKYKYIADENECEHVTLHEMMFNDGYKIAINPSMIVLSGIQGGS